MGRLGRDSEDEFQIWKLKPTRKINSDPEIEKQLRNLKCEEFDEGGKQSSEKAERRSQITNHNWVVNPPRYVRASTTRTIKIQKTQGEEEIEKTPNKNKLFCFLLLKGQDEVEHENDDMPCNVYLIVYKV